MTGAAARPTIETSLFNKYVEFIYKLTGNRLPDTKNYFLTSKIDLRCKDLELEGGAQAYYDFITTSPQRQKELIRLIDEVTVHETFFFRNEPQLEAFERDVLRPKIDEAIAKGKTKLRIWSAAASTGDEAYTTLFQAKRLGLERKIALEIVGTDISNKSIEAAKEGIYTRYAIRNVPQDLLHRHFMELEGNKYQLNSDIREKVTFKVANLKEKSQLMPLGKFDIILCRNVLIYFDKDSKEQVLWNIYDLLEDDGLLLVGHSENLYAHKHIFKADRERQSCFAYTKAPPGTEKLNV